MRSGPVKVSFFGGIAIGRINEPLWTKDMTLLIASPEDLLATKLKAIMDRAEAKDYRDISDLISAGISLEKALGAFTKMYGKDAGLPLRAAILNIRVAENNDRDRKKADWTISRPKQSV